jgi:hypothetical protein
VYVINGGSTSQKHNQSPPHQVSVLSHSGMGHAVARGVIAEGRGMDHRIHELTSELKYLQQGVDRALETVRPLRQATDTMLRELWQMRQEIVSATAVDAPSHQPRPLPGVPFHALLDLEAPPCDKFLIVFNQMMWCTTSLKLLFTNDATVSAEACWRDEGLTDTVRELLAQLSVSERQDLWFVLGILIRYTSQLEAWLGSTDDAGGSG